MKKFKVEGYYYDTYDDPTWDDMSYSDYATLSVRVSDEQNPENQYRLIFKDVYVYIEIYNYRRNKETRWEPAEESWDEEDPCLYKDYYFPDSIETISGEKLSEEDLTDEECDYILAQIPQY